MKLTGNRGNRGRSFCHQEGFVLELTGYVPNAVQSLATQNSIRVLMCIVPALGIILAYVVFKTKYKLNDEFMKKVVAKISGKAEE